LKHLEPVKQERERPPETKTLATRLSGMSMLLVGFLIIAGSGFAMSRINLLPVDNVDAQEQKKLERDFTQLRSLRLMKVEVSDEDSVLDTMRLEPSTRQRLKLALNRRTAGSETTLARVSLWDFAAEDGDVVSLSSAGYTVTVALLNKAAEFAVPVDATKQIQITGLQDGGGGITVAIRYGSGTITMPVLQEGQSLSIPVEF
jgi:hypothetical protein